jgi:hypothetical protein
LFDVAILFVLLANRVLAQGWLALKVASSPQRSTSTNPVDRRAGDPAIRSITTTPELSQPSVATSSHLFDDWFERSSIVSGQSA